jgi:hypothetical protein
MKESLILSPSQEEEQFHKPVKLPTLKLETRDFLLASCRSTHMASIKKKQTATKMSGLRVQLLVIDLSFHVYHTKVNFSIRVCL